MFIYWVQTPCIVSISIFSKIEGAALAILVKPVVRATAYLTVTLDKKWHFHPRTPVFEGVNEISVYGIEESSQDGELQLIKYPRR